MPNSHSIGDLPWSRQDMIAKLEEFTNLYRQRPIQDNVGGMLSSHMFLAWFTLQRLQPRAIVESGVWMGQGTWFFERACPEAKIYCVELDLPRIQYRSAKAEYFDRDFSTIDWNHLPKDQTLLFFDDHQNAYERVKTAHWFGFKHLMFEDNYPAACGDCYSLKKVFAGAGFVPPPIKPGSRREKLRLLVAQHFGLPYDCRTRVLPNRVDAESLQRRLAVYQELPPVFKPETTRWGDPWDQEHYPTPEPLLQRVTAPYQQLYYDEAKDYTWICYARLRDA